MGGGGRCQALFSEEFSEKGKKGVLEGFEERQKAQKKGFGEPHWGVGVGHDEGMVAESGRRVNREPPRAEGGETSGGRGGSVISS